MSVHPSLCTTHFIRWRHPVVNQRDGLTVTDNFWNVKMAVDFFAGCVGGIAGVLVGHPLDTIKVHLQNQDPTNARYRGIWHCMTSIVANDKIAGLYRGMTSPMMGIGFVNAIVFGIYGNIQRHSEDPNSLYSHFLAGTIAGGLQSFVCAPMELAKTRVQLQSEFPKMAVQHKGPLDCMKHIARTEGIRGVFRGLTITAIRDIPGFASYFVSYEYMMRLSSSPTSLHNLLAGGFAGIFSWMACYPTDVIKTCLQADGMDGKRKYAGIIDCAQKGYRKDGYHFFVRGFMSTVIRAFPMNAACFFVVSTILRWAHPQTVDIMLDNSKIQQSLPFQCVVPTHIIEDNISDKRLFMAKSLKAFGAFQEDRIYHSEVEDIVKEVSANYDKYYYLDVERFLESIEQGS